jgi:predicted Zn finger-like uncharacterized protein/uncharacterized protein (TIGR02996 family)
MLITCPQCDTTYELKNQLIPAGGVPVECTRCGRVFRAHRPEYDVAPIHRIGPTSDPSRIHEQVVAAPPEPAPVRRVLSNSSEPAPPPESYRGDQSRVLFGANPFDERLAGRPVPQGPAPQVIIDLVGPPPEFDPPAPVHHVASFETLFAQVVAKPNDDGPRHVLADFLTMEGDPRGEFIELQLRGRPLKGLEHGRAIELARLTPGWLPPGVDAATAVFRRGFLAECAWVGPTVNEHPAWRLVERIDCMGAPDLFPAQFFAHRDLPVLKTLSNVRQWTLSALNDGRVRDVEVVETFGVPLERFAERTIFGPTFPSLRRLDVRQTHVQSAVLEELVCKFGQREAFELCIEDRWMALRLKPLLMLLRREAPRLTLQLRAPFRGPWLELGWQVRLCRRGKDGDGEAVRRFREVAASEGISLVEVDVSEGG